MKVPSIRAGTFLLGTMSRKKNDTDAAETIVAVATPPGEGGIGIVRLSGPRAVAIGRRIFSFSREPKRIESHRLYPGAVTIPGEGPGPAPEGGRTIVDRALFVAMPSPRSYTGEDVVELQCHGSPLLLMSLVEAAVSLGARPARPGEFTQRAFMNGKIDLVQAEAVADLIAARTADGLSIFARHLMGRLSARLSELRGRLIALLAELDASVDFSDQDIDTLDPETILSDIRESSALVDGLIGSYREGRVYREGARLVIAGRPNVGKSSLLNRLLGRPRAIVAHEPGTTTDTIEDTMDIGGVPVRLVDTCGLRQAAGEVEREGVERTMQALATADVTLLVAEATGVIGPEERRVIEEAAGADRPVVLVMNKVDLAPDGPASPEGVAAPVVFTSALVGTGIGELVEAVRCLVAGGANRSGRDEIITNARHYAALLAARRSLRDAEEGARRGLSGEFIALDIRGALSSVGEITGDVTTDDILEAIFSRFCIGK